MGFEKISHIDGGFAAIKESKFEITRKVLDVKCKPVFSFNVEVSFSNE